jgi:hypothetical protein
LFPWFGICLQNTTLAAEVELFKDRVDLKVKQNVPGNKWSVVPSPRFDVRNPFPSSPHVFGSIRA